PGAPPTRAMRTPTPNPPPPRCPPRTTSPPPTRSSSSPRSPHPPPLHSFPTRRSSDLNTLLFRAEGLQVGVVRDGRAQLVPDHPEDRKSTRLNSSHDQTSYAVFCLKKKSSGGGGEGSGQVSVDATGKHSVVRTHHRASH